MRDPDLITSKTPVRISLLGGGSDLREYFSKNGEGKVISSTIDKYIYVTVHKRYDKLIRASYSKTEIVDDASKLKHELIRESMKFMGVQNGIEITSISDVTAHGTGLGSSSSYTVGVLNALSNYKGLKYSRFNLANDACMIEIDKCQKPIGYQDQFAAAFGGLNEITFSDKSINVTALNVPTNNLSTLSSRLLLFDTGIKRKSSLVLAKQKKAYTENRFETTKKLVRLVPDMKLALIEDIDLVGEILHESWKIKKSIVSEISNDFIDEHYQRAITNGALGGKICGAGAGGFFLFYAKEENHEKLRKSLGNLRELEFNLDYEGATLL